MSLPLSSARVGVFADGSNISLNGGHGMRYDVLRDFATRDGAEAVRLNVYVAYDEERATDDPNYVRGQENFCAVLRDFGYKVVQKPMGWYYDESGNRFARASSDLDLAVEALLLSENLDRVLLVTGDSDFVQVVRALQGRGCRVEALAFDEVSHALREEVDAFFSGYLVPNLLPMGTGSDQGWGQTGSRVRGVCYNHSGKGYGFLRYLRESSAGLWITDSRHPDSPYETVFFHDSQLPRNVSYSELPSRDLIFEFELTESDRFEDDLQAVNLKLVSGVPRSRLDEPSDDREKSSGVLRPASGIHRLPSGRFKAPIGREDDEGDEADEEFRD